ncbi:prephenate dehydrogenase [Catenaria anguillulae PL171]|uniref:Prephenate dehydrogenase n=1 Tax=Catenaria anguillulae PL171 TaxID=765915 RepID=A0A1Y2HY93_9FUNG|nr:prephenate dehydrogenase [Catenaria anguillulae PL171]
MDTQRPIDRDTFEIGIIGMGDMGRLYARHFAQAGWKRINVCDLPEKFEQLKYELPQYNVLANGHLASRRSDWIIYSVEAKFIDAVVKQFGPSTKVGAIVSGQTSVKAPEIQAFESHLPSDTHLIPIHSMHGPNVSPAGQPLVIIPHRSTPASLHTVESILASLSSQIVHLSAADHDRITADTQAVTHLAFKSMGTAWMTRTSFPWEDLTYVGGIDNVKVAMTLRIYSNKWHVYAGLALLNPAARRQIKQYARSVNELFSLMIQERADEFKARVRAACDYVFGGVGHGGDVLLADALLDEYTLSSSASPKSPILDAKTPNSHLSLLAMIDCWHTLSIQPYKHLIVQTPPFRLWLGIVEYLVKTPGMLDAAMDAALFCKDIRADDLAFVAAAAGWAQTIDMGHFDSYQHRFEETQKFFEARLLEGKKVSASIIEKVTTNIGKKG